jgi:hypothetical protein
MRWEEEDIYTTDKNGNPQDIFDEKSAIYWQVMYDAGANVKDSHQFTLQ